MFPIVVDIELLVRLALVHHQIVLHHEYHRDRHRHHRSNKIFKMYKLITGLSMEFDKIHLKDAIVTWPDMHSFSEFDKFEPISNS